MAESVIGLYKTECVRRDGPWRTVEDLELATLPWVHWFTGTTNRRRDRAQGLTTRSHMSSSLDRARRSRSAAALWSSSQFRRVVSAASRVLTTPRGTGSPGPEASKNRRRIGQGWSGSCQRRRRRTASASSSLTPITSLDQNSGCRRRCRGFSGASQRAAATEVRERPGPRRSAAVTALRPARSAGVPGTSGSAASPRPGCLPPGGH